MLMLLLYGNIKYLQKEVDIEVNTKKTECVFISHHQNEGHDYNLMIANKSFKNVAKFKYLGTTLTNQSWVLEEIKGRWSDMLGFHSDEV